MYFIEKFRKDKAASLAASEYHDNLTAMFCYTPLERCIDTAHQRFPKAIRQGNV
jgi:hypothetical protein